MVTPACPSTVPLHAAAGACRRTQPRIAATAALGVGGLALVRRSVPAGFVLGILFSAVSMIGTGPHKLFLADGELIAPVALVGFAAEVTFIVLAARHLRVRS